MLYSAERNTLKITTFHHFTSYCFSSCSIKPKYRHAPAQYIEGSHESRCHDNLPLIHLIVFRSRIVFYFIITRTIISLLFIRITRLDIVKKLRISIHPYLHIGLSNLFENFKSSLIFSLLVEVYLGKLEWNL